MTRGKAFAVLIALLSSSTLAATPPAAPTQVTPPPGASSRELPGSFADLVEKLSPAVVNISTTQKVKAGAGVQFFGMPFEDMPDDPQLAPFREFFERFGAPQDKGKNGEKSEAPEREVTSLGSGFIIEPSGFIITNFHVVDEADEITVTLSNNTKYKAKVIGKDKKTDLALLKVDAKKDLPFVPLGDSDKMRVGDWVIAIGNPYGLGGSVTQGIISARQRSLNAGPFDDFLQTDAPINRGNSGGPLFNTGGEVIGINSAIFSPSGGNIGIGFAIPTNLAKPVVEQLKAFGRTHRGWLGVKIQEVSDETADSLGLSKPIGALVVSITKDSPAGKAGVKEGDVITHFDGKEISEMRFLPRMVAEAKIGSTVELTLWRKGKSIKANVKLAELNEQEEADESAEVKPQKDKAKSPDTATVAGMQVAPLTPTLKKEFRLDEAAEGLLVMDIDAKSEAAKRGIRAGDVIAEANNEAVATPDAFKQQLNAARKQGRKFLLLKILRGGDTAFVTIPAEGK